MDSPKPLKEDFEQLVVWSTVTLGPDYQLKSDIGLSLDRLEDDKPAWSARIHELNGENHAVATLEDAWYPSLESIVEAFDEIGKGPGRGLVSAARFLYSLIEPMLPGIMESARFRRQMINAMSKRRNSTRRNPDSGA